MSTKLPEPTSVEVQGLRKMLQHFNEELGQYVNDDQRYRLGQVLTIIDASIADPEQRKAIKDIINNIWWGANTIRPASTKMVDPHSDLRALCEALGFKLYLPSPGLPELADNDEFIKKRYEDVSK